MIILLNMRFLLLIIIFQLTAIMAQFHENNISEDPFEKLNWIVDNWIYKDGDNITYENWIKENDSLLIGESYTVRNSDTVFSEQLKIERIEGDVYYTAVVKHNPGPVRFMLVELGDNKAVFENPEHDFPNRIIYELRDNSVLHAKVEGKDKNGRAASLELFYKRVR